MFKEHMFNRTSFQTFIEKYYSVPNKLMIQVDNYDKKKLTKLNKYYLAITFFKNFSICRRYKNLKFCW